MFREKYILDNEMIKPDELLLASLKVGMITYTKTHEYLHESVADEIYSYKSSHNLRPFIKYSSFVACFLLLIITIATLGSQNDSKKETAFVAKDTVIANTESTQDMEIGEYSTEMTEDSSAPIESADRKFNPAEEEAKFNMKSTPSKSFIDGKINITKELVDTILISNNLDDIASGQAITDKGVLSDFITCLNTLTLTLITPDPSNDISNEYIITIQYTNENQEDTIYVNDRFLRFNDNEFYEISEADSIKLNSFLK